MIDYYAVLQIRPSANLQEIRNAYRRLAFQYHPDITGNTADTAQMQLVNEAYSLLKNPIKRASYDYLRKYAEPPRRPQTASPKPRTPSTAGSILRQPGQPSAPFYAGNNSVDEGISWAEGILNFFYRMVNSLFTAFLHIFVLFLVFLTTGIYATLLGYLVRLLGYPWHNTRIDDSVFLIIVAVSVLLTLLTIRLVRKVVNHYLHRTRFYPPQIYISRHDQQDHYP
jgi:curved DNA-binding protein CbpA